MEDVWYVQMEKWWEGENKIYKSNTMEPPLKPDKRETAGVWMRMGKKDKYLYNAMK